MVMVRTLQTESAFYYVSCHGSNERGLQLISLVRIEFRLCSMQMRNIHDFNDIGEHLEIITFKFK